MKKTDTITTRHTPFLKFKKLYTKNTLLLLLILVIAASLRLYNLKYSVGFDFDQEYAATFANTIINIYPIQMIGQGLSVQGLFMGPWYFYYLVPFFFLTHLNPIGGYIASVILGLLTVIAYYIVGRQVFGEKTALLLAFFRAILFTTIQADWTMAPSYSSELALLLTWWLLYKYWKGNSAALLGIGFLAGLYTSFHPILFPVYVVIFVIVCIKWRQLKIKNVFLSIILFILPLVPLIAFEYFHNFLELKLLFSLSHTNKSEAKDFQALLAYIKLIFYFPYTYLSLPNNPLLENIYSFIALMGVLFACVRKLGFWKDNFHRIVIILFPITTLFYYYVLPVHAPDYYFLSAQWIYLLYVFATFGLLLQNRKLMWTVIGFVIIIFCFNIQLVYMKWQSPQATFGNKEDVINYIVSHAKNSQYNLSYIVGPGEQYGYGYLVRYFTNRYQYVANNMPAKYSYTVFFPAEGATGKIAYKSGDIAVMVTKNK